MTVPPAKTAFVKSYGCQMNVYDSTRMQELLAAEGYGMADGPEQADLVVLNTCHIREKASDKVYSELGKVREMKEAQAAVGKDMVIAVAGCVAQAEGHEITRRNKAVDLVFGPQTYHRLPAMLKARAETGQPVVETEFPADDKFDGLGGASARKALKQGVTAFLTVQEGCDKFCSFCVVPYTRGAEFSRPVGQVLDEARVLAENGVREITLLGQNVNAYRGSSITGSQSSLAKLVAELSLVSGIDRIRYTTSHPRDMTDDLIAAHADNPKLMPYLHLPVQAGNDRVLKAMNRGHTAQHYMDLIATVRKARPDIAISGDFIVGFPGETEADFQDTMAIVREVKYASAYSFKYSERPGTPAADRKGQIPEDEKNDRLYRLQALLAEQMTAFNHSCIGRTLDILVEKNGRNSGQMIGRSPYLQSVHFAAGDTRIGDIVNCRIDAIQTNSLSATVLGKAP
jgi:tRNA-2-methylthio-N6-dimethylallyladenosine synthase